jgi:hypothetical protein
MQIASPADQIGEAKLVQRVAEGVTDGEAQL